ncbi:MAG TPA: hybrid sensor histidine kinase/response regulator [Niabella sp.]|nr:hybrid sensor histidine kinase/response regulator [Niabella sp.]HQW14579.1 hybrid sensor histidine kinase/response regulator [Niabella sp.]HQX19720.1 hybrid sensor histidine kinase/response regulator [Niabella sp.]HQX41705.1 hybrid sensor histidine kinase/response regulator [Niabella sp.]HRB07543.1 hybrid sensor histidine kinase/response regulator [Niabella sp.]
MPSIKVLYVDDEPYNLESFRAMFRRQYEIFTASSAMEAYDILEKTEVHVIVSDQKMPDITGVEFFKSLKEKYPDPLRILVTGFVDVQVLADAINHGDIYHYITKPWNDLDLKQSIANAYEAYAARASLKEKVISLQRSNDELNRFVYSISHELRAPLTSAIGIINLIKLEDLYHSSGSYWELMETCIKDLDYYINNILDYYKNSRFEAERENIDFQALVDRLISIHKKSDLDVKFFTDIVQENTFFGDKFRTELIFSNLISNAIRYQNPEETDKKVDVLIRVNAKEALINIVDNGVGIPKEIHDKIFNQFFRGQSEKGTGLGLFILKEALSKLNGSITVDSLPKAGSRFIVRLPNNV